MTLQRKKKSKPPIEVKFGPDETKNIVLILFVLAVVGGFMVGRLSEEQFILFAGVVISFFFGARNGNGSNGNGVK